MGKIKDLSGRTFYHLTVIEFSMINRNHQSVWICRCDCGNYTSVTRPALLSGNTKSCGCMKSKSISNARGKNIQGLKFGRLTVRERFGSRSDGGWVWLCECECGNVKNIASHDLISGATVSCRCYATERKIKRATIHGLSKTKEYASWLGKKRREMESIYDTNWTVDMEIEIKKFFQKCVVCGISENLAVDHVYPLSKGNGLTPGNAIILCQSCNSKKYTKNPEELPGYMSAPILECAERFRNY